MSHALYDGVSCARQADYIAALCGGRPLPPVAPFSTYGCPLPDSVFPGNPRGGHRQGKRVRAQASVAVEYPPKGVTVATVFSAVWGVALARLTGMQDVIFGRAVSGRASTSAAADHEAVIRPCFNLVPARMRYSARAFAKANFDKPSATVGGRHMQFHPVPLERPDLPEPPRLVLLPRGRGEYVLELSLAPPIGEQGNLIREQADTYRRKWVCI
ncbi:hypothetical protein VTI74DRAFT_3407 [Chaetomium olivicolor]